MVRGLLCKGKLVRKRVGRSKRLAEKVRGDIEAKLERAEAGLLKLDYPIRQFFKEYLERTIDVHSASYHNRNERVIKQFERFLDTERPYLTKLSQLTMEVIEAYQRFRLKEITPYGKTPIKRRTVNIEVSSLNTFLNKALKWNMLSENPLRRVEYLKETDSKKIRGLTEKEVRKLLAKANGWFRPVLLTGLREGELISIEWDDLDLNRCIIHIRLKPDWAPKSSGRSIRERDVAIPKQLAEFLREFRKNSSFEDSRVFHNREGKPLRPGLRKVLMRLTAKCGFPEVTQLHALRHAYTTELIRTCKDIAVAQDQLGHADIRTTMRYSDLTLERKQKATESLDYGFGMPRKPENNDSGC